MAYEFVRTQNIDISGESGYWSSLGRRVSYTYRFVIQEYYDPTNNKTRLSLTSSKVEVDYNGEAYIWGAVNLNGTTLGNYTGYGITTEWGEFTQFASATLSNAIEVTHDSNGDASAVTMSFAQATGQTYMGSNFGFSPATGVIVGFGTGTTRTISIQSHPRGSTIASCTNPATTNSNLTLTVNRGSTSFYHRATFKIGSTTLATSSAFASSLTYAVPRSWFDSYPNDTSKSVTVSVKTYTSSACTTQVGSEATTTITVKADSDMKPSVDSGWATASVYNDDTAAAGINKYIKGFSKATITFDNTKETLMNGAAVASRSIKCQGVTVSAAPYRTPTLTSTSVQVVCTLTDSRGRTATQTKTITVNDYAKPKLSNITAFRCGSGGTADENGTYFRVKATRTFSSVGGSVTCTLTCQVAQSGGTYGSEISLVSGEAKTIGGTYSVDKSYTVRFKAHDTLGGTTYFYATIPSRKWAMKFRPTGNGVAFGKAAEYENTFEVSSDWAVKLGQPLALTSGGTGANSAAGARTNLGIRAFNFGDNQTGYDLSLESATAYLLVLSSRTVASNGLYIILVRTDGTVDVTTILSATRVTLTAGTNTLNLTPNTSTYYIRAMCISF